MRAKSLPILISAVLILLVQDATLRGIRSAGSGSGRAGADVARAHALEPDAFESGVPSAGERGDAPLGLEQAAPVALSRQFVIDATDPAGFYRDARGIAIDRGREIVYVVDSANHRIQAHTLRGEVLAVFGGKGRQEGRLLYPMGADVAPDGTLYVADYGNARVQQFASDGRLVRAWDLAAPAERDPKRENHPLDLTVGPDGSVYVVGNFRSGVHRYSADGTFIQSWETWDCGRAHRAMADLYSTDMQQSSLRQARLERIAPTLPMTSWFYIDEFVVATPNGHIYVGGPNITQFEADGRCIRRFGGEGIGPDQLGAPGPFDAAFTDDGSLLVVDGGNGRIQRFDADGRLREIWSPPGNGFEGIGVARDGSVFVTDGSKHEPEASRVLRLSSEGLLLEHWGRSQDLDASEEAPRELLLMPDETVLVTAGDRLLRYTLDGAFLESFGAAGNTPGRFANPRGLARSSGGALYVADTDNHRVQMFDRAMRPMRSIRSAWGHRDGLVAPSEVMVLRRTERSPTELYVSDAALNRVFVYHSSGADLGYTAPYTEGGEVALNGIHGIDHQPSGTPTWPGFYFVDSGNDRVLFSDILWDQVIELGGKGAFLRPHDIAVNREGRKRVFVSDRGNHRIRVFDHSQQFLGDWSEEGSDSGKLRDPQGLALTPSDGLIVADSGNQRVQVFDEEGRATSQWPIPRQARGSQYFRDVAAGISDTLHVLSGFPRSTISIYDGSGDLKRSWNAMVGGHSPMAIATSSDGITYAATYFAEVGGFNLAGELVSMWKIEDEDTYLRDIAVGPDDLVYLLVEISGSAQIWIYEQGGTQRNVLLLTDSRSPNQLVVGNEGILHVLDENSAAVEQYDREGAPLRTWRIRNLAEHAKPNAIALGPSGSVYVSVDRERGVREYDASGMLVGYLDTEPACDGILWGAINRNFFRDSQRLEVTSDGNLVIARALGQCVESYALAPSKSLAWRIDHFPNPFLAERPVFRDSAEIIDFDWRLASPDGRRVPPEGFSTRLEKQIVPEGSRALAYDIRTDGGLRMWVDDQLIVDHPPAGDLTETVQVILSAGTHRLLVEYRHRTGPAWLQIAERDEGPAVIPGPTALPSATPTPEFREPTPVPDGRIWLPVLQRD